MADHIRKQIRDAIVSDITGLDTTGDNVYSGRVYPYDVYPCLAVYTELDETSESIDGMGYDGRVISVNIEAHNKTNSNLAASLDEILAEVYLAIRDGASIAAIVDAILIEQTRIEINADADQPTGTATIYYKAYTRVQLGDPTTIL